MLGFIVMLACTGAEDSVKESEGCKEELFEVPAEGMPGWTPAAGCESLCAATDDAGHPYVDCYLTSDEMPICQYGTTCD